MQVRFDIDMPKEGPPRLIGIWLEGFSWQLGGGRCGDLTVRADVDLDTVDPSGRSLRPSELLDELKNALTERGDGWGKRVWPSARWDR